MELADQWVAVSGCANLLLHFTDADMHEVSMGQAHILERSRTEPRGMKTR